MANERGTRSNPLPQKQNLICGHGQAPTWHFCAECKVAAVVDDLLVEKTGVGISRHHKFESCRSGLRLRGRHIDQRCKGRFAGEVRRFAKQVPLFDRYKVAATQRTTRRKNLVVDQPEAGVGRNVFDLFLATHGETEQKEAGCPHDFVTFHNAELEDER